MPSAIIYEKEEIEEVIGTLRSHNFGVNFEPEGWSSDWVFEAQGFHKVDAKPVRKEHKVSFDGCDLSQEAPLGRKADLVLANNVLYHLQPAQATRFVRIVAEMLKENGVLSLGSLRQARFRPMGMLGNYSSVRYSDWLSETADLLNREFDLEPIVSEDTADSLKMFARP